MKFAVALLFSSTLALGLASVLPPNATRPHTPLAEDVCYDNYGCFTSASPWSSLIRPLGGVPRPPYEVGTRFLLFTRANPHQDFELVPDNEHILADSAYDRTKDTVFLIHGFTESHLAEWIVKTRNALLAKEDINVIAIDWEHGAARNYLRTVNNARMVGAQLIRLLNFLKTSTALDLGRVRIVAHSVGAHAASYAGDHFWGAIGHITALDPAEPYFGGADPLVRIDKADAGHVQVIHTNGDILSGMGIRADIGHVDIYVNGGNSQPGCSDLLGSIIGSILNLIGFEFDGAFAPFVCSHVRAVDYYVESITSSCPFVAHKCNSYGDYNDGLCTTSCSGAGDCVVLGYTPKDTTAARGTFHLNTDSEQSFCLQAVQFDTTVSSNQDVTKGKVILAVSYDGQNSKGFTIEDGRLSGGQILGKWVHVPSRILGSPTDKPLLHVRYERDGFFDERYLNIDDVTISILNDELSLEKVHYKGVTLDNGRDTILYPL